MAKCAICGFEGIDISRHIRFSHSITCAEYKNKYGSILIDSSVELKRKETCKKIYGNPNFKNEEAKKLSNEIYEGGHSLRDPSIREKGDQTKFKLYGYAQFTNRDKATKTCLERYGVDNVAKCEETIKKRVRTCIERYGRIFNYEPVPLMSKEELVDLVTQGMPLASIGEKYGITGEGVGYWAKKYGISVVKKIVTSKNKEYIPAVSSVESYLRACRDQGKVLSFSEYGKLTENKYMLRMKRLFNAGARYSHLKGELFRAALSPDSWSSFIAKLNKGIMQ
jgi:hypothetical protein